MRINQEKLTKLSDGYFGYYINRGCRYFNINNQYTYYIIYSSKFIYNYSKKNNEHYKSITNHTDKIYFICG